MAKTEWQRAKQVFHEALEKTGPERAKLVAVACGADRELRAQVEALLAAHDEAGEFLASPTGPGADEVARAAAGVLTAGPPEGPGTRIGPYKLLQVIGEGGFGVVYMAEQEHPIRRRVALKIIKLGMDTKEVIARFEAERQALALMDHPNIARVLDAGATESGRPYFVMELVKGVPITEYCDANRLSTRERLELFVAVCRAIHHAHDKGVVHRDIKPSNVMVTLHDGTPLAKVIDFGIAKAMNQPLTEKTLFTAYGEFIGTPTYMSPEQAALGGLEIDRRCDVYALGVLLYELLTGTTPFEPDSLRSRAFLEIMRIIREDDPPTPSARVNTLGERLAEVASQRQVEPQALAKLVRGDLDWIVTKAMEKDRRRRYESAVALAEDVARHFRHEPVTARRPSTAYRLQKFATRRRGALMAAAGIGGAIVVGGALAQMAGLGPSRSGEVGGPTRRLVWDSAGGFESGSTTQDGRHRLRYDAKLRGFELIDLQSRRARVLTREGPDSQVTLYSHALSPDGRSIASMVLPGPVPRWEDAELRIFSVGGEGEGRAIYRWEGKLRWASVFGWSPKQTAVWTYILRPDETADIASVDVADGTVTLLKRLRWRNHTQHPSLSPDGRFVAYHDSDSAGAAPDIFLVATDGSRQLRIEHPTRDGLPMFTPDGSGIVFRSDRDGGDLWFLPVADGRPAGEPRPVWTDIGPYGQAQVFGGNGSLFYYFATNAWEIYTADVELGRGIVGTPQHIPPRKGEMNNAPEFSPDGQYLAHMRDGRRLVLRELSTSIEREYPLPNSMGSSTIDFCPDGRTLLVAGYDGRRGPVVFRVHLDRGGAEQLNVSAPSLIRPVCAGDAIIYGQRVRAGDSSAVVRRSLATGEETTLYKGVAGGLHRSPDGSKIAFLLHADGEAQLLVMPSRGGRAVTVATSPLYRMGPNSFTEFHGVVWLPAGDGLLVVRAPVSMTSEASEVTLWRIPIDGGNAIEAGRMRLPVHDNAVWGSWNYSLHPSGSRIAFERHAGWVAQEWAIDNLLQFIQSGASVAVPDPRR